MPRRLAAWIVVGLVACGGDDGSTSAAHDGSSGSSGSSGAIDPLVVDDDECEAAGGVFGIIHGPVALDDALGLGPGVYGSLGLVARDDALWLSFSHGPYDGDRAHYMVDLDPEGTPLGPMVSTQAAWAGGRVWPAGSGAVVSACDLDEGPRWYVIDAHGETLMGPITPPSPANCGLGAPAVATAPTGDVLLTWVDAGLETACESYSCVALAHMAPDGTVVSRAVHAAGDVGVGPSSSVAAGPTTALVVALLWSGVDDFTGMLVAPVDFHGEPLDVPVIHAPIPQPSDHEELKHSHALVVADGDDGFLVFVGGYGPSLGRMRIGVDGALREAITELPVFHQEPIYRVFERELTSVAPRAGGFVAHGSAEQSTIEVGLLAAIDPRGEARGIVVLRSSSIVIASRGERTWAVHGSGLQLSELGCVPER